MRIGDGEDYEEILELFNKNKSSRSETQTILLFNELKTTTTNNVSKKRSVPELLSNFSGKKTPTTEQDLMGCLNKIIKPETSGTNDINTVMNNIVNNIGSSNANGKIDRDFKQGKGGDCWLLAGIESAAQNPRALAKLNNQIKVDKNGNVTVNLKGVHRTYTITKEELKKAGKLSKGDLDVRAIELAIQKYYKEQGRTIYGGTVFDFYKIMFGTPKYEKAKSISNRTLNELRSGKRIGIAGCVKTNIKAHDKYGNEVPIVNDHMYAIKSVGNDTIELVNPWDTSKTIIMPIKDFKKAFDEVSTIKI